LVIAAAGTLATENELPDYKAAASYIEAEAGPDDVVVDLLPSIGVTPVPLTPLDAYLDGIEHEYRVGLPKGEPPFLSSAGRPAPILLRRALRQAHGQPLTFVAADGYLFRDGDEVTAVREGPATTATFELPPGSKVVAERRFPGFFAVNVVSVEIGSGAEAR
jgi:hypothetical protein